MNSNLKKLAAVVNLIVFVVVVGQLVYTMAPDIKRWVSGHRMGATCVYAEECRSGSCVGMTDRTPIGPFGSSGPVYHGFCSDTCGSHSDCDTPYVCDEDLGACVPAASSALGEPCKGNWDCTEGECAFEMEIETTELGTLRQTLKDPTAFGECITEDEAFDRRMKLQPNPLGLPF